MMSDNIWILVEYSFTLFEAILLFYFLSNTLRKKSGIGLIAYTSSVIIYSLIVSYLSSTLQFSGITFITFIMISLFFSVMLYEGAFKKKILFVAIFFIVLVICDILAANVLEFVMGINTQEMIFKEGWFRVLLFCSSKLILFNILRMIINLFNRNELDIPLKYWYMIISMFFISLSILVIIGIIGVTTPYFPEKPAYIAISVSGILLINIFVHYVVIQLSMYYEKEQLFKIINIKNEIMEKHYLETDEAHKETRKLAHDFKNHFLCVSSLLEVNNTEGAKKYLVDMIQAVPEYTALIKSGNDIADAVLNQKMIDARKLNVSIEANAIIPDELKIGDVDLCAILSNVIDNALEASVKIKEEHKRKVSIKINPYKDYLLISVSNYSESNPYTDEGELITSKVDFKNHGLGIKIIQDEVKKYNGSVEFKFENNVFYVKILIK